MPNNCPTVPCFGCMLLRANLEEKGPLPEFLSPCAPSLAPDEETGVYKVILGMGQDACQK